MKLYYAKTHEWAAVTGDTAKIGISDYAQHALGDLVYVTLPDVGASLTAETAFCEVESVKAVSEVFAPLSGTVTAVNTALEDAPELLNSDPLGAWICAVAVTDIPAGLMDEAAYADYLKTL